MNSLDYPFILAALSGEGMVRQLVVVLVVGICALIVWWLGKHFIEKLGAPPIVRTVWDGLFILLGGLCLINFLLGLVGYPIVRF
jgi:hypothetical protein